MIAGLVLLVGGAAAGVFGSLLGLGGGVLIVPLLNLGFGLPLRQAVAISLVSVIVTSSASAAVYLQRHVANLRLGMTLELFSAGGALIGGLIAFLIDERVLAGLFAILVTWVAISMARRKDAPRPRVAAGAPVPVPDRDPEALVLDAVPAGTSFTESLSGPGYRVHSLPVGMGGSIFAGLSSALLGVGGGVIKVPTMHLLMGVPLRVSTATSNMMMGITATSSAVIYLLRDELNPYIAGPVVLGVFIGATFGSAIAHRVDLRILRWLFVIVLLYTAVEMTRKALGS
jgi:uncharacterized protein